MPGVCAETLARPCWSPKLQSVVDLLGQAGIPAEVLCVPTLLCRDAVNTEPNGSICAPIYLIGTAGWYHGHAELRALGCLLSAPPCARPT